MVSNNINPNVNIYPNNYVQQSKVNPTMNGQFGDSPIARTAEQEQKDKYWTFGLMAPLYIGLSKLYSHIMKSNGGEYEKSLIGRIANFGDKLSVKIKSTKLGSKLVNGMKSASGFTTNVVSKSDALSAMAHTPSVPEYGFVRDMSKGAVDEVARDFVELIKKETGLANLDKKHPDLAKKAEALKKLEKLGFKEADLENFAKNPKAHAKEMIEFCEKHKVTENATVAKKGFFSKIFSGKEATYQQTGNRLRAMTQSSKLGRFMAKAANRGAFGLFVGGGIFMLMSAHALADATIRTKNAEKGDKFSTFMEGFLGNISWVITFPLTIKLMNAVGGLANWGKSKADVAKYDKLFNEAKELSKKGFKTKAEYDAAWKAVKEAKKLGKKPGLWGKLVSLPGKILTLGRQVKYPFIKANPTGAQKFGNLLRKIPYGLRNHPLAILIGFGAYMKIFSPIVEKLFVGASHAVFGKPKHSMYDEEEIAQQDEQATPMQNQEQIITNETSNNPFAQHTSQTNLINMRKNGEIYQEKTSVENNVVQNKADDGKQPEPIRTYIPSPEGGKFSGEDSSAADAAILRAKNAEKMALETLQMKI